MYNTFDPENVSKEDMSKLADHIEEYIDQLENMMIIPEELIDQYGKQIEEGIARCRKLIKKLRKGDKSIFKDTYDENSEW